ncbi:MAG: hypothetical protein ACPGWR_14555 [Ardenticatenaceae bacterium]
MIGTADGKTNQSGNESNLGKSSHEASRALNSLLSSPRLKRLALQESDLAARKRDVADIERVRGILGLAEDQIDLVVEAARSGNEAADADEAKILALQVEILALRRVMSQVEGSRKAADIRKLFDDGSSESAEEEVQAKLLETLKSFGMNIQRYEQHGRGGKQIIQAIRGRDKVWTVSQGAIYAPFVLPHSDAITHLAVELTGGTCLLGLERGGSFLADQITLGRDDYVRVSIPKREIGAAEVKEMLEAGLITQKQSRTLLRNPKGAYKVQQQADLQAEIHQIMSGVPKEQSITIAITETMVGGGSARDLLKTLRKMIRAYRNVKFKVLLLEQTMQRERGEASGMGRLPLLAGGQLEVIIQSVQYILGEDVNYQLVPGSQKPIIVFRGVRDQLVAYQIVPKQYSSARDVLLDLIDGAYNGFLPSVL